MKIFKSLWGKISKKKKQNKVWKLKVKGGVFTLGEKHVLNMLDNLVDMKYLRLEKPKDLVDGKKKI